MPSLRPPMQKNLSPAPVRTITRVRVSRRISLMQSRISWHIRGVNMLPSSGRLSVMVPIGPSSAVGDFLELHGCCLSNDVLCAKSVDVRRRRSRATRARISSVWAPSLGGGDAVPSVRPSKRMPRPTWGIGPSGPSVLVDEAGFVQCGVLREFVEPLDRPSRHAGVGEQVEPVGTGLACAAARR